MNVARESIYSALWALVSGIPGLVTASRRLVHWSDVPPEAQPALFQAQKDQAAEPHLGLPTKWRLRAELFLYVNSGADMTLVPATQLNNFVDAIDAALAPPIGQVAQTLGGLVQYCRISGEVLTDEGVLGPQAVAIIPIEILGV
jgi:hypothetical protein